jgi:hypothetical protein
MCRRPVLEVLQYASAGRLPQDHPGNDDILTQLGKTTMHQGPAKQGKGGELSCL